MDVGLLPFIWNSNRKRLNVSLILTHNLERSEKYGNIQYSPDILVDSLDLVAKSLDADTKYSCVILYSSTLSRLKKLTKSLAPYIEPSTLILVNSSFSILLEPIINSIIPQNIVLSIFGTPGVRYLNNSQFLLKNPQVSIYIGLSCGREVFNTKLIESIPLEAFKLLSRDIKNSYLDSFIHVLRASEIASVQKVPLSGKTTLSEQIWKQLIASVCFDCFSIIYHEYDIFKLFHNPLFSPPIRHVLDELLHVARQYGCRQLPRSEKGKNEFMQRMIDAFKSESKNVLPSSGFTFSSNICLPPLLYSYVNNQETNINSLVFQLILLSSELKIQIPNIEFLYSVLYSQVKQGSGKNSSRRTRPAPASTTSKQLTDIVTPNPENLKIKAATKTQEAAKSSKKSSATYSSGASSMQGSIDSNLKELYVTSESFVTGDEDHNAMKLPLTHSTAESKAGVESFVDNDSDNTFSTANIQPIKSPEANEDDISGTSFEDSWEIDYSMQSAYFMSPQESKSKEVCKDIRNGNIEEELVLINGPYYQEELPNPVVSADGDYHRPKTHVNSFTNFHRQTDSQPKSANDFINPSIKGYRKQKKKSTQAKLAINKGSHELVEEHARFIETMQASNIADFDGRYGYLDSYIGTSSQGKKN